MRARRKPGNAGRHGPLTNWLQSLRLQLDHLPLHAIRLSKPPRGLGGSSRKFWGTDVGDQTCKSLVAGMTRKPGFVWILRGLVATQGRGVERARVRLNWHRWGVR